ncbi:MAG: exodeoxyribonuclease III [Holosporales bacterium]|nr:exodeoxyribonuclease III [Holosporales bacterium]
MKIITWNVNSVRARLHLFGPWLSKVSPDVVLLQELKCQDDTFPFAFFEEMGFSCKILGQKSYNGVAILSKRSIEDVQCGLPTFEEDKSARYIEAVIDGKVRIASIYVPNGGLVVGAKEYLYKLEFLRRFKDHIEKLNTYNEITLIGGDYNIAPDDFDVYNAKIWHERVCCTTEEREAFKEIMGVGYTDLLRDSFDRQAIYPKNRPFTWWDYRSASFTINYGLRIDHFLANSHAQSRVENVYVDTWPRKMLRPSDHAPVVCELNENA